MGYGLRLDSQQREETSNYSYPGAKVASYTNSNRSFIPGIKRPGREADRFPVYTAEIKYELSCNSTAILACTETTCEDNIKMDLQEVGCGVMDWMDLVQDRGSWRALMNAVMSLWVPQNVQNLLASQERICSVK